MTWYIIVLIVSTAFIIGYLFGRESVKLEIDIWKAKYEHSQRMRFKNIEDWGKWAEGMDPE